MNGVRCALDDRLFAEDRARDRRWTFFVLALAIAALALAVFDCGNVEEAHADDRPTERTAEQSTDVASVNRALLRVVVAEEGLRPTRGHEAILEVLARRSPGRELTASIACRYSAAFDRDCEAEDRLLERDPWIAHLEPTCDEPERWHPHLSWPAYRPRCLVVVAKVERFLAGELAVPLDRRVVHFGAPHGPDLARAIRAGWRLVRVPGARTFFWAIR